MRKLHFMALIALALGAPAFADAQGWQSAEAAGSNGVALAKEVQASRYTISKRDIEKAVSNALVKQGIAEHLTALVTSQTNAVIAQHSAPLSLAIHGLEVDTSRGAWQAEAYMVSQGKTLSTLPISGRYDTLLEVPVLVRALTNGETVEAKDLATRLMPERQLRKDTITDANALIGKSPRRVVSAQRPIRLSEVTTQMVIKKGASVEMLYTTPYLSIRSMGEALENGSMGDTIRILNNDSERTVSAKVVGINQVQLNPSSVN